MEQIKDCSANHCVVLSIQDLAESLPLHRKANSIVKPVVSNRIVGCSHNFHEKVVLRYFYIHMIVVDRIGEGNMLVVAVAAGVAVAADSNLVEHNLLVVAGSTVADNNTHLGIAGMGIAAADNNLVEHNLLVAAGSIAAGYYNTHLGIAGIGIGAGVGCIDQPDAFRHSHSHIPHSVVLPVCRDENEHPNPIHYHALFGLRECDRDQKHPVCGSREVHQNGCPICDQMSEMKNEYSRR